MYKRPMVAREDRVGPDGLDLRRTRARDDALTARLAGAGLDVSRVEVDQANEQPVLVTWRSAPSDEAKAAAEDMIGPCQHVW